jgi:hypothetical protein
LEGVGGELVDTLAELEFGPAQDLVVGLAGQEPCESSGFLLEQGFESLEEVVGELFLIGGKRDVVHG